MARDSARKIAPYTKYAAALLLSVEYAAEFHDLGKLDDKNQEVLRRGWGRLPINHVDGGVAFLLSNLLSNPFVFRNLSALIIYSHHLGLPSLPSEAAKGSGRVFRDEMLVDRTDAKLLEYFHRHESSSIISGSVAAADYTAANRVLPPMLMRMALSCLVDADHSDTARNYKNIVPEGDIPLLPEERLDLLDRYVEGLGTDDDARAELRKQAYHSCRNAPAAGEGIIACDSPVGTGKTTAVMAHLFNVAHKRKLRRIFVIMPFTNIIDQSVNVYRKALVMKGEDAERVVAAHHHRAEFEDLETRAFSFLWNAPITVTTAVQFFETLAGNHPAALRKLHQVAGSAIFIDEAHAALPAHLWPQAWKWLQELARDWGCYIVMASGSLTRFWELEEFSSPKTRLPELAAPSVRASTMGAELNRIAYKMKGEPLALEELCNWVAELPGPRLVILNTVQSAATVAMEMVKGHGRGKIEHLSTSLAPVHRKATLDRVKERLKNQKDTDWTLVATSCVEAGVDFSFRSGARELCSLVSSIQTGGRINRAGEFGTSELWLFRIEPGELLKGHPAFKTSARILADMYREQKVSPDFCIEAMRREIRDLNQCLCENDPIVKAENSKQFPEVDRLFKVIASDTLTVVTDKDLRERIERHEKVEPSEIQQKTVAVYSCKALQYGVMPLLGAGDLYAWMLEYDDFIGYMTGVLKLSNFVDNCCI
ncbi:MAG TPA: CRISPR-associated protein [Nitrospiraceae bacterium]|nr:CRISPR-associated protein [Nitrospiraceae bacterium]